MRKLSALTAVQATLLLNWIIGSNTVRFFTFLMLVKPKIFRDAFFISLKIPVLILSSLDRNTPLY